MMQTSEHFDRRTALVVRVTGLAVFVLGVVTTVHSCSRKEPPIRPDLAEVTPEIGKGLPFFKGSNMDPVWRIEDAASLRHLGDFKLTSSAGREITQADIKDKFVIVSFFYSTCVGICPTLVMNLKGLLPDVQRTSDVVMVSFSVDPDTDIPAKIEMFRKARGIDSDRWLFLTGSKDQLFSIARDTFNADTVVRVRKDRNDFIHSENVYLLDRKHYLRAVYRGRGPAALPLIRADLAQLRQAKTAARL